MLLRISLFIAILAGIGTIVLTQLKTREHVKSIIAEREMHRTEEAKEKAGRKKAETELTSTKEVLTQYKANLAKTKEELNGAKQAVKTAQDALDKVKLALDKAIEDKKTAQAELAKWEILGVKPEQVREMVVTIQKQKDSVAALEGEKQILNNRVNTLVNQLKRLLGENYVVELPAGTKGNVLTVDPKWNFVVLDRGQKQGMLPGGIVMVHRHSQLVGKVQINEVLENRCVANVMTGWSLGDIEEGDEYLY